MSLKLDALVEAFEVEEALDKSGYVLTFGTGPKKCKKATSASTAILGFAFMSTKNPITGTPESGVMVGVIKPRRGIVIDVPVTPKANRTTNIEYGDVVVVDDAVAGTICHDDDSTGVAIGYAREALAADADPEDGMLEVEINVG